MQALPSEPESLMVVETSGDEAGIPSIIHLHIGLQNGYVIPKRLICACSLSIGFQMPYTRYT